MFLAHIDAFDVAVLFSFTVKAMVILGIVFSFFFCIFFPKQMLSWHIVTF